MKLQNFRSLIAKSLLITSLGLFLLPGYAAQADTPQANSKPAKATTTPTVTTKQTTSSAKPATTTEQKTTTDTKPQATITIPATPATPAPIDKALATFAEKASLDVFNYSYKNYKQHLTTLEANFTKEGWRSFISALQQSQNLTMVEDAKLTVTAELTGTTQLLRTINTKQGHDWVVQVPITVNYTSPENRKLTQHLFVKLLITHENTKGYAIRQFIAMPDVKKHGDEEEQGKSKAK